MSGPPPKDPSRRVRRNADQYAFAAREVTLAPADETLRQLPDDMLPPDQDWHPATRRWWATWASSPMMADLPDTDWMELQAAALVHHQLMVTGKYTFAGELRSRMAKFGATPADRMRLRISTVTAEEAERKAGKPAPSTGSRARERHLRLAKEKSS